MFPQPTGLLVATAKKVVPVVGDAAIAVQVGSVAKYTAARLGELRSAIAKVGADCCNVWMEYSSLIVMLLTFGLHAKAIYSGSYDNRSIELCATMF